MKSLLFPVLFLMTQLGQSGSIPDVPSRITIADLKLTLTEGARKDIQKDVEMLRSSEKFFRIKLDRVVLYMSLVERILKEENIPDDVKYLAIQESAFIPDAVSTSKAVGFWQFKDFTARDMGLRVDKKIDERKNIQASTRAAAKYFRSHQKQLDNWANSINAHMTGATGVKKYISPKDKGAKKMTITKKTHWYLKRFIAHKIAFQDELDHRNSKGLELLEYKKGAGKDLEKIAREFKIDVEELRAYNKWLIHGKIPGDKAYVVMVPVKKGNRSARQLAANSDPLSSKKVALEEARPKSQVVYPKATVSSFVGNQGGYVKINGVNAILAGNDDDFESILKRAGIKEKKLLKFNDLGGRPVVKPGDIFFVKKKKKKSEMGFYTVGDGESIWDVSQQLGIRLSALLKMNRMSIRDIPKPGRVLWLSRNRPSGVDVEYQELVEVLEKPKEYYPGNKEKLNTQETTPVVPDPEPEGEEIPGEVSLEIEPEAATAPDVNPDTKPEIPETKPKPVSKENPLNQHIVEAGETLWGISRSYGVTVTEILQWNDLPEGSALSVGQVLRVGGEKQTEIIQKEAKTPAAKTHIVRGGDTFYSIARKYEMSVKELMKLNGLNDTDLLSIGQELNVSGLAEAAAVKPETTPKPKKSSAIHQVVAGESFYAIARKYGISVDELLELNDLEADAVLSIGQELLVGGTPTKKSKKAGSKEEKKTVIHEVKSGDTLYSIARKYNMSIDELKKLNNKQDNNLSLGEKLKVYE